MTKLYETVIEVLKQDKRFFTKDHILLRNAVYEAAMQMDENLLSMLLANETTKALKIVGFIITIIGISIIYVIL